MRFFLILSQKDYEPLKKYSTLSDVTTRQKYAKKNPSYSELGHQDHRKLSQRLHYLNKILL